MTEQAAPLFTAAEIAQVLGVDRVTAKSKLATVPHDGIKLIRGQRARAWRIESLPPAYVQRLEAIRQAKRFPSIADLLTMPVERYFSAVPLAEIAQPEIDAARRLQRALMRTLQQPELRGSELESAGLEDYAREFGRDVSASHWARLYRRTIERDGGLKEWHRIELFLPENPQRIGLETIAAKAMGLDLLAMALANVGTPAKATIEEKDLVWLRACDQLRDLLADAHDQRKARKAVLKLLSKSGCVGKGAALARNFQRKWKSYKGSDHHASAILDKRPKANQQRLTKLPEQDRNRLIAAIVDCEGRASQGWREARAAGVLSGETHQRFITNPRSKSYVPQTVLRDVALDARKAVEARRRPRTAELNGAYIPRDPEGLFAGDSYCADAGLLLGAGRRIALWLSSAARPVHSDALRALLVGSFLHATQRAELQFASDPKLDHEGA
jgi:hypothetical protein